jgi:hypothetical protein
LSIAFVQSHALLLPRGSLLERGEQNSIQS